MRRLVGSVVVALAACSIPVAEQPAEPSEDAASAVYPRSAFGPGVPDRPVNPLLGETWEPPSPPAPEEVAAARARVRRLRPSEFAELPPSVVDTLDGMGCLVPQTSSAGPPGNVVRGDFFERGKPGWAVVCSVGEMVRILAFRDDADTAPDVVVEREEQVCVGEEWNCGALFGTSIRAVGREFIESHYEAYGGPKPPPVDHEGIDEGIWDKASIVHYFHEGHWLQLTGAD